MTLLAKLLTLLFPYERTPRPKTELDFRRQYAPKHNPGFDVKARGETAKLCGVKL